MIKTLSIIFFSLVGLLSAFYLWRKKQNHGKVLCPLKADCSKVITSSHSKMFGVSIEVFGILYYVLIGASYALFLVYPEIFSQTIKFILLFLSLSGFIFSIYLVSIQAFVLRAWCFWCVLSAIVSTVIFFITILGNDSVIVLLGVHRRFFLILHILAVTLGMGGALITDILFFKFLKDYKITEEENSVMNTLSEVIWFALLLLVISGIGIYLPKIAMYNATPKFLAKMSIILVIIVNGFFLNKLIAPHLLNIRFVGNLDDNLGKKRKLSFAFGAVSMISWITSFVLAMLKNIPQTYIQLMGIYVGLLIVGIVGSQIAEKKLSTTVVE